MHTNPLIAHFTTYFYVTRADTLELRKRLYQVRYQVYCEEFGYERRENFRDGMEKDAYDDQSLGCLLIHKASGVPAGCFRLITAPPRDPPLPLPFEAFRQSSRLPRTDYPDLLERGNYAEISRIASTPNFRRRRIDEKKPLSIPEGEEIAGGNRSGFPIIPISLVLAGHCLLLQHGMKYLYAMFEPRLANMYTRYGIIWKAIGEVTEFHGQRCAYLTLPEENYQQHLDANTQELMRFLDGELAASA
jgi:N-acyl amino acid synthase of PEP-CTERM/exosortase system